MVRGARISPELEAFKPRIRGFYGNFSYYISSASRIIGEGERWSLYSGDISPETYADTLAEVYERTAPDGYRERLDRQQRNPRGSRSCNPCRAGRCTWRATRGVSQRME